MAIGVVSRCWAILCITFSVASALSAHHQLKRPLGSQLLPKACRLSRRQLAVSTLAVLSGGFVGSLVSNAAETVGKDPDCDDRNCLGVWDGLLADCPHPLGGSPLFSTGAGCTSSQDDTPGIFSEPWDYSETPTVAGAIPEYADIMRILMPAIQLVAGRRGDQVRKLLEQDRYLRIVFTDGKTREESIGEFYITPQDTTVQFRLASIPGTTSSALSSSGRNIERAEAIRKELRFTKVPVLRNRQRSLFFFESDELDRFGPGSAALGPPAEMRTGELEGRQDVDPNMKIDLLQNFPLR